MVEVLLVALIERELREIAIVEVQREERCVELRGELACKRGFAGAGTAGDADDGGMRRRGTHGDSLRELYCSNIGFSRACKFTPFFINRNPLATFEKRIFPVFS